MFGPAALIDTLELSWRDVVGPVQREALSASQRVAREPARGDSGGVSEPCQRDASGRPVSDHGFARSTRLASPFACWPAFFGSLAAFERELINERAAEARAAAAARGRQTGRPVALTPDQQRQSRSLRAAGESVADLCRSARVTVYRLLGAAASMPA